MKHLLVGILPILSVCLGLIVPVSAQEPREKTQLTNSLTDPTPLMFAQREAPTRPMTPLPPPHVKPAPPPCPKGWHHKEGGVQVNPTKFTCFPDPPQIECAFNQDKEYFGGGYTGMVVGCYDTKLDKLLCAPGWVEVQTLKAAGIPGGFLVPVPGATCAPKTPTPIECPPGSKYFVNTHPGDGPVGCGCRPVGPTRQQ
jgi:hypothetical protein